MGGGCRAAAGLARAGTSASPAASCAAIGFKACHLTCCMGRHVEPTPAKGALPSCRLAFRDAHHVPNTMTGSQKKTVNQVRDQVRRSAPEALYQPSSDGGGMVRTKGASRSRCMRRPPPPPPRRSPPFAHCHWRTSPSSAVTLPVPRSCVGCYCSNPHAAEHVRSDWTCCSVS